MRLFLASVTAVVVLVGALGAALPGWAFEADPIAPGSWTIISLPDTQYYVNSDEERAAIFDAQTQWIVDHRASHNVQMVLHQGDVTNDNTATQFTRAEHSLDILANAGVPYSIAPGNHDNSGNSTTRYSLFNNPAFFGPGSAYAAQSHLGGFFEADKTDNSYSTFSAGGRDWLVFSVEFGPRNEVVQWMDNIAQSHPNHHFILNTHAYLYSDSTRYDWITRGASQTWNPHAYGVASLPGGVNDGEELWDKLVRKHENWRLTLNGHVLNNGTGHLSSHGDHGNVVHQILANYQMRPEGGEGYLRIMEFMEDGDTVKVSSYSPYLVLQR